MPSCWASCGEPKRTLAPSSHSSPSERGSAPVIALIKVDLPAPFSPMSECTSPGNSRKSTASRAASAPKYTVPPASSSTGVVSIRPLSPQLSSTLRAEHDDALDPDEDQQHQADDDPRPRLLGPHERDDRLDGAEDEHPDHR